MCVHFGGAFVTSWLFVCAGVADQLPVVTFFYDFPPETQFYDHPLVYMPPNSIVPLHAIPAPTLKQRIAQQQMRTNA
jgi:hypothetical protein